MLKIGIVVDPSGYTLEEEQKIIAGNFCYSGIPVDVRFIEHGMKDFNKSVDVLVIDYGGMDIFGSPAMAREQVRLACKWAEEHPGKVLFLFTKHTSAIYKDELESEFADLNNIIFCYNWDTYREDGYDKLVEWFSLEKDFSGC